MKLLAVAAILLATSSLVGCKACEKLEEKICSDLGAEDCAIWRENGGPDFLYKGRRQTRACVNMSTGPTYDAALKGARATVDAHKNIETKSQAKKMKKAPADYD